MKNISIKYVVLSPNFVLIVLARLA